MFNVETGLRSSYEEIYEGKEQLLSKIGRGQNPSNGENDENLFSQPAKDKYNPDLYRV